MTVYVICDPSRPKIESSSSDPDIADSLYYGDQMMVSLLRGLTVLKARCLATSITQLDFEIGRE